MRTTVRLFVFQEKWCVCVCARPRVIRVLITDDIEPLPQRRRFAMGGTGSGSMSVYALDTTGAVPEAHFLRKVSPPVTSKFARLGTGVAADADLIVGGADGWSSIDGDEGGAAFVYVADADPDFPAVMLTPDHEGPVYRYKLVTPEADEFDRLGSVRADGLVDCGWVVG